jgi:hypothetical protein
MEIDIKYNGVEITLEGIHTPEGFSNDYFIPNDPAMFEIEKVIYKGKDVTDLFEIIDDWDELEFLALEKI